MVWAMLELLLLFNVARGLIDATVGAMPVLLLKQQQALVARILGRAVAHSIGKTSSHSIVS